MSSDFKSLKSEDFEGMVKVGRKGWDSESGTTNNQQREERKMVKCNFGRCG